MNWFSDQREKWIGETLFIFGHISRGNLERKFRISTVQASLDLQKYMKSYPNSMRYDAKKKLYIASYVSKQQKMTNLPQSVKRIIP